MEEKYTCVDCNYTSNKIQNYNIHINSDKHKERKSLPVLHTCKDCKEEYRNTRNYYKHRILKLCKRPVCDYCKKIFTNKQSLKYHVMSKQIACYNRYRDIVKKTNVEILHKTTLKIMAECKEYPLYKMDIVDWMYLKI